MGSMIATVALIVLHLIDGRTVTINPDQVTRLSEAREDDNEAKALAPGVRCVVYLTDGRFVSVAEECDTVRGLMEATP